MCCPPISLDSKVRETARASLRDSRPWKRRASRTYRRVALPLFCESGIPVLPSYSLTGTQFTDMLETDAARSKPRWATSKKEDWEKVFGYGLIQAVSQAVDIAAGTALHSRKRHTVAARALEWFVNSYPLLGALAASFDLIEDPLVCNRAQISVAAVNDSTKRNIHQPWRRVE